MTAIEGSGHKNRFPRGERIKTRPEIDKIFVEGARHSVKGLRLHSVRRSDGKVRVIFITVRKFGGSVRRNRARRLVSEAYRLEKSRISGAWEFVFVVYPGFDLFTERREQVQSLLSRSGAIIRTR